MNISAPGRAGYGRCIVRAAEYAGQPSVRPLQADDLQSAAAHNKAESLFTDKPLEKTILDCRSVLHKKRRLFLFVRLFAVLRLDS